LQLGKNLRQARLDKGYSLQDLAELSNVSRSMLSKIERNEKNPTINVLCQIAEALDLTVSQLLGQEMPNEVVVIRKKERISFRDKTSGMERHILSPSFPSKGVEFILNIIPKGCSSGVFPAHKASVREYIYIDKGSLRVQLGDVKSFTLEEGDSIYFEADVKHQFDNIGDEDCRYFLVIDSGNLDK
jgi:transcriptional regulator with XRE-family HTH domain